MTRRLSLGPVLFIALASVARAGSSVNLSIDTDRSVSTCRDIRIHYDSREAARAEESFTLPATAAPLRVQLPENSGILVTGRNRDGFSVTVCKAARRSEDVDEIHVSPAGAGLAFRGPSGGDWTVYLIVSAPRDAALDLEARNGSIAVRAVSGRITARTTNGPISLEGCSGTGDARAVNGPIDFSGSRGTYRLDTKNGPISVELEGNRWEGGSLDAHAVNGPLSLKIADGYASGVRVEMLGHGPVTCPSPVCRSARKSWDEESRTIEFGDSRSDPVVRLSTENGPVSVASAD